MAEELKIGDMVTVVYPDTLVDNRCSICRLFFNPEMNKFVDKKFHIAGFSSYHVNSYHVVFKLEMESVDDWVFCEAMLRLATPEIQSRSNVEYAREVWAAP